jgi:hypothetical protein
MKTFITSLIFLFTTVQSFSQDLDNADFGSAEERVAFNKQNNIPKYEGVLIEYEYRLVDLSERSVEEWMNFCKSYFSGLIGVEVYAVNNVNYFSVLTEGARLNHEASYSIPVDLGYKVEFTRRKYHLK